MKNVCKDERTTDAIGPVEKEDRIRAMNGVNSVVIESSSTSRYRLCEHSRPEEQMKWLQTVDVGKVTLQYLKGGHQVSFSRWLASCTIPVYTQSSRVISINGHIAPIMPGRIPRVCISRGAGPSSILAHRRSNGHNFGMDEMNLGQAWGMQSHESSHRYQLPERLRFQKGKSSTTAGAKLDGLDVEERLRHKLSTTQRRN